jgi:hypothetical protein
MSEALGAQQRVEQIGEQAERYDRAQDQIEHDSLLEPVAGVGVDDARQEKAHAEGDEDDVEHDDNPIDSAGALSRRRSTVEFLKPCPEDFP